LGLALAAAGALAALLLVRRQTEESLRELAAAVARRHGLDPKLVDAVIRAESRYNPDAVSNARAYGLMQVTVATARETAGREVLVHELFEPHVNVDLGCRYLQRLLRAYGGDLRLALMAYNAGPGSVDRWRKQEPDPERILRELAYAQTRAYVAKVLAYLER
ncbi:MAG: lytic transglycosylase domain-containing protein, partial [Planctomycetota bacterium]